MISHFKNRNFYFLLVSDALLFTFSLYLAYSIRFSFNISEVDFLTMVTILPWVIVIKWATFLFAGVYRGMWRYTSIPDVWELLKATFLAMLIVMVCLIFINRFHGYPRSVFLADSIFTFFFCGGIRGGIRMLYASRFRFPGMERVDSTSNPRVRLVLIGAGDAADKIIREVQGNPRSRYEIVCCLDDDVAKHHRALLGIPIRGPVARLGEYARHFSATEALIAMPSIAGDRMRAIVSVCKKSELPFKTLPSMASLIDGKITINDLRPVNFEDLLGRPAVKLDTAEIGKYLTGKVVAISGAGGSIGSELCRQIARFEPAAMVLIDAHEFNLYNIEMELRAPGLASRIFPVMGRVQDRSLMSRVLRTHRPQVVFHAAAYKHVPMVELNPWEGINNNVLGSQVIMDLAQEMGVERFVLVSSDKAVRPTNVMGASKRMAEMLLQSRKFCATRFMAVRFGNVVGSSGSVVPLFQKQIQAGGPVTVTDPEMTRYFMTIPEACQLILQAGTMGEGGEIFILEMGTPVKIADMARDLIRLSGKRPGEDIEIVYTGLRPGEKLYEELITHGEGIVPTHHEKIMVLRPDAACGDQQMLVGVSELIRAAGTYDAELIRKTLKELIPEYVPSDTRSVLAEKPG